MTATAAQLRKVFGKSAVWAVTFIARPTSPSDALAAWTERSEAYELAAGVIRTLERERETQPERPTRCLLCPGVLSDGHARRRCDPDAGDGRARARGSWCATPARLAPTWRGACRPIFTTSSAPRRRDGGRRSQ